MSKRQQNQIATVQQSKNIHVLFTGLKLNKGFDPSIFTIGKPERENGVFQQSAITCAYLQLRFDLSRVPIFPKCSRTMLSMFVYVFEIFALCIFSLSAVCGAFAAVLWKRAGATFVGRLDGRLFLPRDTFADFGKLQISGQSLQQDFESCQR